MGILSSLWERLRSRFSAPELTEPKYEIDLTTTPVDSGVAYEITVRKTGGSGYWSKIPAYWWMDLEDGTSVGGQWTYDFRWKSSPTVVSTGVAISQPVLAEADIVGYGIVSTEEMSEKHE